MIEEKIKKLEKLSQEKRIKLIYEWVKSKVITFKEFEILINLFICV